MNEIATIRVKILEREFPVSCPLGQEAELEAAATFVDTRMREIRDKTERSSLERLAVMAALNIAHDFLTGKSDNTNEDLERLANKIEITLEKLSDSVNI